MVFPNDPSSTQERKIDYLPLIQQLSEGIDALFSQVKKECDAHHQSQSLFELESVREFLSTFRFIYEAMPEDRLCEILHNTLHSLRDACATLSSTVFETIPSVSLGASRFPEFVYQAYKLLGPYYRIDPNEMTVWIRIPKEEAVFFDSASLCEWLNRQGIKQGVNEETLREIFVSGIYDQEVCAAKGKSPIRGKDGKIEYVLNIEDFGYSPKNPEWRRVSFKDINLYAYLKAGDVLAVRKPPDPGTPGYTVTNRLLSPPPAREANFPDFDHTEIVNNGNQLIVKEDCCITKKKGKIQIDPCLKIQGDVSYASGNIDSQVSVIVMKDVLSGFSIRSTKDILIHGIVEGSRLEAQGNIAIKSGVQGKDKAWVETNSDITAKFLAHASVTCLGQITVESEIRNCMIWSDGRVIVSGISGQIVGGEIEAESDVLADTIGSELGVKTYIRLGMKAEKLAAMIRENAKNIEEQEEAADKCAQIVNFLDRRRTQTPGAAQEIEQPLQKARTMLDETRKILDQLHHEADSLEGQYEEYIRQPHTVRARSSILPGVVIQIQGIELTVVNPTGPVTAARQGDEVILLPFKEIDADTF